VRRVDTPLSSSAGPQTYLITWIYGSINVILFGFSYTLPTILTQLGYTAEIAQLMTVPLYGAACILTFLTSLFADRIGRRSPVILVGLVVSLIGLVMLAALPKDRMAVARYIGCLLVLIGGYPAIPGTLAWNCE
jgi:MFS family permease